MQAPSQVMLQIPLPQETFEPAPTVCVHCLPTQATSQFEPQLPVHVASVLQLNLQPDVEPLQASKLHEVPVGHEQLVPLHTLVPQLEIVSTTTVNKKERNSFK